MMVHLRFPHVLAYLSLLVISALAAMQTWPNANAMTVEEARKLAAADKAPSYALPPRTIDDITKVLEQNRPDPQKSQQLRATADQPVPAGLGGMTVEGRAGDEGRLGRSARLSPCASKNGTL